MPIPPMRDPDDSIQHIEEQVKSSYPSDRTGDSVPPAGDDVKRKQIEAWNAMATRLVDVLRVIRAAQDTFKARDTATYVLVGLMIITALFQLYNAREMAALSAQLSATERRLEDRLQTTPAEVKHELGEVRRDLDSAPKLRMRANPTTHKAELVVVQPDPRGDIELPVQVEQEQDTK